MKERQSGEIPFALSFDIPLKNASDPENTVRKNRSALNWPVFLGMNEEEVKNLLAPFSYPDNKKLNRYYKHTIDFVEQSFKDKDGGHTLHDKP